jgi:predicted glycoside hydrolase/deacetylase ChbG (UPF0249 family)
VKRLVVTADDVGLHRGMTEGAIEAHRNGVVTACSVVANGVAFEHAVEQLRATPELSVGVHLTLVEERPLSTGGTTLVGSNGLFHESYLAFVPRFAARMISIAEVERELRMQIERVLAAGFSVAHLNGHQHLHLLPRLFALVDRLAAEYRVPSVRIVRERRRGWSGRSGSIAALSALGVRARRKARSATNDRTIGVAMAGHLASPEAIIELLDEVEGTTELVCHPGLGTGELAAAYRWEYQWEAETRALCDPRLEPAMKERGIALVRPGA